MGRAEGKEKKPKGLILKTLERCRSLGGHRSRASAEKRQQMPPEGWFSVYVGPTRERFFVRTDCVNHALFRALLDEAEMEFGYAAAGPLELPCAVELFERVLWEVEQDAAELSSPRCNFAKGASASGGGGYFMLSPGRPMLSPGRPMITGRV